VVENERQLQIPEAVFTPATPVSREMFATRRHLHLQDRVEAALQERGRQVVLHGDTGVGKTSLVRYLTEEREIPMVEIGCGRTYEDMLREALAQVIGWEEVEQVEKSSQGGELGINLIKAVTGRYKSETGKDVRVERYPTSLGTALAEAFRIMDVRVLFLDNYENLQAEPHYADTSRKIVQLMKAFSDLATYYGDTAPKVVVAGIPVASQTLLEVDEATGRRTAEIEVPRMPADELDEILLNGERLLGVEFAGLTRERILYYSDGFPYYTHLLALPRCGRPSAGRAGRWSWMTLRMHSGKSSLTRS
jgi:ATPase family associated with various cellular activities (AAA)